MPVVERLEFPKRYKLKDTVFLLIILGTILGILITNHNNKSLKERIIIHSVSIVEYDRQVIRLGYDLENKGRKDEQIHLLAKVYDAKNEELASILFAADIKAVSREFQTKVIDKLSRPLQEGEEPHRTTIELQTRKSF